jgi:hypothetical protein
MVKVLGYTYLPSIRDIGIDIAIPIYIKLVLPEVPTMQQEGRWYIYIYISIGLAGVVSGHTRLGLILSY